MPRLSAKDFQPEVLDLFDRYVHGDLSRRGFLDHATRIAGSATAAAGLLAALSPQFAAAQQVAPDDARIVTRVETIDSPRGYGKVRAYMAKPAGASSALPTILVVHENRGLNPHIEDIARRLALDGFLACAPDALTSVGGYPGDEDKARALFSQLSRNTMQQDFLAAAQALKSFPDSNGKLGTVGFCFGGDVVNFLATQVPELRAAVPFYGMPPLSQDIARIRAPLLLHFAGDDARVLKPWPDYEAALKAAGKNYQAFIYPGVQHGFNNDTTPRYDEAAARLAWQRSVAFFRANLA